MELAKPLTGKALAVAAHDYCRHADPGAVGLPVAQIEEALVTRGIEIGGDNPRSALSSALNGAQNLFVRVARGTWQWIEPNRTDTEGISGEALAEEAYRVAVRHDPERQGIHYGTVVNLLHDEGTIIQGGNPGKTTFQAMSKATSLFDKVDSGLFRWK